MQIFRPFDGEVYVGLKYPGCRDGRTAFEIRFGEPLETVFVDDEAGLWLRSHCSENDLTLYAIANDGTCSVDGICASAEPRRVRKIFQGLMAGMMECDTEDIQVIYGLPADLYKVREKLKESASAQKVSTLKPPTLWIPNSPGLAPLTSNSNEQNPQRQRTN